MAFRRPEAPSGARAVRFAFSYLSCTIRAKRPVAGKPGRRLVVENLMSTGYPFPHGPIRHRQELEVAQRFQFDRLTVQALRLREVRPSEAFTVLDSRDVAFRCRLLGLGARAGEAEVYEQMAQSPEPALHLHLFCAVLARQRMMLVTQKAIELGVAALHPLISEYSVPADGLDHQKAHAWPRQAVRAARQCRRSSVPPVHAPVGLSEALQSDFWRGAEAKFYLDVPGGGAEVSHAEGILGAGEPGSLALATGPEGGWGPTEREALQAAGARPLVLAGRVLRAETSVLVALTLLQHRLGDLLPL